MIISINPFKQHVEESRIVVNINYNKEIIWGNYRSKRTTFCYVLRIKLICVTSMLYYWGSF
jgi:hypothetical protein